MVSLYENFLNSAFRTGKAFRGMNKLFNYSEKEKILKQSMDFVYSNKISGDYYEFGVYEGNNFVKAILFSDFVGLKNMKFFAFDSFEGLPSIEGKDQEKIIFHKEQFSASLESFKEKLKNAKINQNKVEIVRGWFNETLKNKPKGKASIIFIDVDLYESCVPVMEYISPLIQDGTIILFDDYFCYSGNPNLGERKAFEDWLKKNKDIIATPFKDFEWHGRGFVLHIKKK